MQSVTAASVVCALLVAASTLAREAALDERIRKLLASISEQRLSLLLHKLQSFETRNTLSTVDSTTRGIGAARRWIFDEMRGSSARLQVTFDSYRVEKQGRITRQAEIRNVVAILPGRSARRVYFTAHYDSLARSPEQTSSAGGDTTAGRAAADGFDWTAVDHFAPGANDDGSGTALVMELARLFGQSGMQFDATLVFVAFAGEEQGLFGATLHAQKAAIEKLDIDAVLNNDIVGNVQGGDGSMDSSSVRVFSEGGEDSRSRQLARFIRRHAARYVPGHRVRLIARADRFGRGGDHTAFNQQGYAAVRLTESRENYARQHTRDDTVEGVSVPYLAQNARVNAAAAAVLALAPPAPEVVEQNQGSPMIGRGASGYDATLKWTAVAGAAGYRVFWRDAWALDWEHQLDTGSATELTLPSLSIDDHVFGVAAIGPEGHESLVTAFVNPPRAPTEIKTLPDRP